MTTSVPPSNVPLGVTTPMQRPKKSGCGCCGCLTAFFVLCLIAVGGMIAAYFFWDFGPFLERQFYSSYKSQIRPLLIQRLSSNLDDVQSERAINTIDLIVDEYMSLPEERKKPMRSEMRLFLWYKIQGEEVPDEKIPNLLWFQKEIAPELQKLNVPNPPRSRSRLIPSTISY